jgi:hypothetical protein
MLDWKNTLEEKPKVDGMYACVSLWIATWEGWWYNAEKDRWFGPDEDGGFNIPVDKPYFWADIGELPKILERK